MADSFDDLLPEISVKIEPALYKGAYFISGAKHISGLHNNPNKICKRFGFAGALDYENKPVRMGDGNRYFYSYYQKDPSNSADERMLSYFHSITCAKWQVLNTQ